jgi:tyrosine-protein kinase Etk/Wzc
MEQTIDISSLWKRMWAYRRPIAVFVTTATLLTAVVAFILPPWYQATASLLPPSEEDSSFGIARLLKGVAVPGIKIPTQATPADVFLAVLDSRRLREEIVTRFGLMKVYKRKYMQDAIKDLKKHTKFKLTDAGTIDMQLEDTNAKRASDMLSAYIELLDRFNREVRTTKGRRTRMFVEERLTDTKAQLAKSEQLLADYQSRHKAAIITPEMSTAAQTAAEVYARRSALEVKLGVIRSYSHPGSQEEQQIVDQMAQLDRQLSALPETGLELARQLRDVKKYEQIYILLTAQYEEARIDEARDVVTVDLLDPPIPPERKTKPHRLVLILTGFLMSLGIGLAYAAFQEEKQPGSLQASSGH